MGMFARAIMDYLMQADDDSDSADEITPAEPAPPSEPVVEQVVEQAEEVKEPVKIRESTATGNDKIEILRHALCDVHEDDRGRPSPAGIDVAIQNLAGSTIATSIIEVSFYDIEGNVVDTARHKVSELRPNASRSLQINSRVKEADTVKSYDVRIAQARTADHEKVQLRSHGMSHNAAGEELVEGIVKNISQVKADTAVVISFFDANKEDIGRKIIVLRDIEPDTIRQFDLAFKPPEGETVGTYSIALGDMAQ